RKGFGDLDQLLLSKRELVQTRVARNLKTKPSNIGLCLRVNSGAVNQFEWTFQWLASQKHICRNIQIIQHVDFLVNESDAEVYGIADPPDIYLLPIKLDCA